MPSRWYRSAVFPAASKAAPKSTRRREMASVSLRSHRTYSAEASRARSMSHTGCHWAGMVRTGYGMPTTGRTPAATHWWTMAMTADLAWSAEPVSMMSLSPPINRTISGFWGRAWLWSRTRRPVEVSPATPALTHRWGVSRFSRSTQPSPGARLYPVVRLSPRHTIFMASSSVIRKSCGRRGFP